MLEACYQFGLRLLGFGMHNHHHHKPKYLVFEVVTNRMTVKGLNMHAQAYKGESFPITISGATDAGAATKNLPSGSPTLSGYDDTVLTVTSPTDNGDGTFAAMVTLIGEPGTTTSIIAAIGAINGKLDVSVKLPPAPAATQLVITAGAPAELV